MMFKLFKIGSFYMTLDLTIIGRRNVLIGTNYCEGMYAACKDRSHEDCVYFEYAEMQFGFFLFTISFGKENLMTDGPGDQS